MRAVVQRVKRASVVVDDQITGAIEAGILVLLSAGKEDDDDDVTAMIKKLASLRIFPDPQGKMNLDVRSSGGAALVVSQFTLHGDARKGHRPSFMASMAPELAKPMIAEVCDGLRAQGLRVEEGIFGAHMEVSLINDGPVTILLDTRKTF